ncbi:hypothetical protein DL764_007935 [Monosporascus ibericus]|uniref:Uncharacterized protein n=1 Tax=Monosporascus ibericus TaxID=155417 RepID=A0A4Q4T277_9PEZI|nr:hypothetical protein DL764_007935 [Monosporascus ibericus]
MAEDHSHKKGCKPIPDSKKPIDIWAAVSQVITKVTLAADLDINHYELWNQYVSGLIGLITRKPFSIFAREEVPPPRSLDRRLVFTGSVSPMNLRGLWAMAEEALEQERHQPASQREQGDPTPSELSTRTRVQSSSSATPTGGGAVLGPEEDIYGVSDDEERGGAVKFKKTKH